MPGDFFCRDDRLLPASWARRAVSERLGLVPEELVERLERLRATNPSHWPAGA